MKTCSLVLGLALTTSVFASSFGFTPIHESADNQYKEMAKSTAAMVDITKLIPKNRLNDVRQLLNTVKQSDEKFLSYYTPLFKSGSDYLPLYETLEANGLCRSEAWASEAGLSNCSGTLVSDRHIVTAGHCADVKKMCEKYAWIFDYQLDDQGQLPKSFSRKQVYSCKKIIKSVHSKIKIYGQFVRTDYAVIELDRPVQGRKPIELSKKKFIRPGTKVVNISYPIGTPGKISDVGTVSKYMYLPGYFWSDVMVFGGSSGSGMFNAETGELIGVVSQGINNLEDNKDKTCKRMIDVRVTDPVKNGGQVSASAQMRKVLRTLKKIGVVRN